MRKIRIVATADLHGRLPKIPSCDVLVVAGDISPLEHDRDHDMTEAWLKRNFKGWLESANADHIVGIAGNHDFFFESHPDRLAALDLPWTYLLDSGTEIDGVKFWGLPWCPSLSSWAFHGYPDELEFAYDKVPWETDVVVSHAPLQGHLDNKERKFGAIQVNDMVKRVKPRVFISGHIHEGYGREFGYRNHTDLYNVSHCDIFYDPVNRPVIIDL